MYAITVKGTGLVMAMGDIKHQGDGLWGAEPELTNDEQRAIVFRHASDAAHWIRNSKSEWAPDMNIRHISLQFGELA